MATYLRPRRGYKEDADKQNFILKKGEVFFEYPDNGVGSEFGGRIKLGDGITPYSVLPYFYNPDVFANKDIDHFELTFDDPGNTPSGKDNNIYFQGIVPGNYLKTIIANIKGALVNINSTLNTHISTLATSTVSGHTKLYTSTGTATDGTMTQNAINTALNTKVSTSTYNDHITTTATSSAIGHTKLYTSTGTNTDGTITQKAITNALNNKVATSTYNTHVATTGTSTALGHTKLYTSTGTATDGTMTQNAINDALDTKVDTSTYNTHIATTATSSAIGHTKLYTSTGTNTDGTMTQSIITDKLSTLRAVITVTGQDLFDDIIKSVLYCTPFKLNTASDCQNYLDGALKGGGAFDSYTPSDAVGYSTDFRYYIKEYSLSGNDDGYDYGLFPRHGYTKYCTIINGTSNTIKVGALPIADGYNTKYAIPANYYCEFTYAYSSDLDTYCWMTAAAFGNIASTGVPSVGVPFEISMENNKDQTFIATNPEITYNDESEPVVSKFDLSDLKFSIGRQTIYLVAPWKNGMEYDIILPENSGKSSCINIAIGDPNYTPSTGAAGGPSGYEAHYILYIGNESNAIMGGSFTISGFVHYALQIEPYPSAKSSYSGYSFKVEDF